MKRYIIDDDIENVMIIYPREEGSRSDAWQHLLTNPPILHRADGDMIPKRGLYGIKNFLTYRKTHGENYWGWAVTSGWENKK